MQVQDQILSPRFGGPIIGAIRDYITASYLFTRKSHYLTKREVGRLLVGAKCETISLPQPEIKEPVPLWSGKQIFSLFLPQDMNYVLKSNICRGCSKCLQENCKYDSYVVVKNGKLLSGVIDRRSIGSEQSESLLHRIVKDYGNEAGRSFLNKLTRMLKNFITIRGFTYSYDELVLTKKAEKNIRKTLEKIERKIEDLIRNYREGTLPRLPGQTLENSFEIYVMNELATARDQSGKIADEDFTLDNSGIIMTRTGARGSSLNIGQMSAIVGQQAVRGKRIMRGYLGRALPHFKAGDPSPKARGFVYSSYQKGLNASEFFFHAMGGREGLVDTAVRTQQSGYMQRRLVNALEHLRLEYDGTVRNSAGDIIQMKYGEDGVDPSKSDHGKAVNVSRLIDQIKREATSIKPLSGNEIKKILKQYDTELTPLLIKQLQQGLTTAKLDSQDIMRAINLTDNRYKRALMEPGEAVGIIAAQSIGEPGTQMTLRTFHYAGVREQNVTLGLPRLIEIVDARKAPSTPIMTIFLTGKYKKNKELAVEVARNIISTTVEDLSHAIYEDPLEGEIVIEFDATMMEDRGVNLSDIKKKFDEAEFNFTVVDNSVRINLEDPDKRRKMFHKMSAILIKGVTGIKRVLVTEERGEWVIRTDGSNLGKVLEVVGLDVNKTITNNIHEITSILGIEAARNVLINETKGVLEEQGLDVDIRHVMLVSDIMTSTGGVQQIGRHGISGKKSSVLAKAAFEITVPNIVEAAVKGHHDPLQGVTENVIVGQSIPIGTGLVELYMSTAKLRRKKKK